MFETSGTLDASENHKFSSWDAKWKCTTFSFLILKQDWAAATFVYPDILLPALSNVCERHILGSKPESWSIFTK